MLNVFSNEPLAAYKTNTAMLIQGDSLTLLERMFPESVDMIFADPPYFLSSNGITCQAGRIVSVNKGEWDSSLPFEEKHAFNRTWIRLCRHVLKPNGSIWISGTLHNIYSIGTALEQEGFKIINNITWQKTTPHPILLVGVSHTVQKQFYGHKKMIKMHIIFSITN